SCACFCRKGSRECRRKRFSNMGMCASVRQCAPGDLGDLVRCIARLRNSPALCTELGQNASAACAERTWTHNAAKVIDRVEAMIKQNSTGPRRALGFGSTHAENWFFFVSYRGRREVEK